MILLYPFAHEVIEINHLAEFFLAHGNKADFSLEFINPPANFDLLD